MQMEEFLDNLSNLRMILLGCTSSIEAWYMGEGFVSKYRQQTRCRLMSACHLLCLAFIHVLKDLESCKITLESIIERERPYNA